MRGILDNNLNVVDEDGAEYELHLELRKSLKKLPWLVEGAQVIFEIDHDDAVLSLEAVRLATKITNLQTGKKAGFWNIKVLHPNGKTIPISTKGELDDAEQDSDVLVGLDPESKRVVWALVLVGKQELPALSVKAVGLPPSTVRLLSNENFSKFEKVFQSETTCKLLKFECPLCDEKFEIGMLDKGCPECEWKCPGTVEHVEPFKPVFHDDTNLVKFLRHTWMCPTCERVVPTFDEDLDRQVCSACKVIPAPFYFGSEFVVEDYQVKYTRKPTLDTWVSPAKMVELMKGSQGHLSVLEIISLGDEGFDEAKKPYDGGGCPHCDGDKGCNSNAAGRKVKKFSEWYCLDKPESKRTQNRARELKLVLDGLPKCSCGPDRNLKAIPQSPCNVFRDLDGDIDPGERHWNNSKDKARNNRVQVVTDCGKGGALFFDPLLKQGADQNMQCHTTPRSAGGCFLSGGNVIPIREFCPTCQCLDELFTLWQGENACGWGEEEYVARFVSSQEELEERQTSGTTRYLQVREEKELKIKGWVESIKKSLPK